MVNKAVLEKRLTKLEQTLRKLKELSSISWDEYKKNEALQDRAERNLQLAAQACIDIGSHIIADREYRTPSSYSDIFNVLQEEGLLPKELAEKMKRIAGFRNILVHDYLDIDPKIVHACLGQLNDFKEFAEYIVKIL